jgi:hypothetical protein
MFAKKKREHLCGQFTGIPNNKTVTLTIQVEATQRPGMRGGEKQRRGEPVLVLCPGDALPALLLGRLRRALVPAAPLLPAPLVGVASIRRERDAARLDAVDVLDEEAVVPPDLLRRLPLDELRNLLPPGIPLFVVVVVLCHRGDRVLERLLLLAGPRPGPLLAAAGRLLDRHESQGGVKPMMEWRRGEASGGMERLPAGLNE